MNGDFMRKFLIRFASFGHQLISGSEAEYNVCIFLISFESNKYFSINKINK